jgi:DNA topoisomerase-1
MKNKTLVIVESPTKAKTISRFLDSSYVVEASFGHVRDLPKSKIGIDVKRDFTPTYMIPAKAKERVAALKKEAEDAADVILATDEDREGEAIAWHLTQALELGKGVKRQASSAKKETSESGDSKLAPRASRLAPIKRIVFHEITKPAILEALEHPRSINMDLVDAQQARRILDRLVGYELSPFLWRKIRYGLSAGRVQSVAVRLVVEREREIGAFRPQEYWSVDAVFKTQKNEEFEAHLSKMNGKAVGKMDIASSAQAHEILEGLRGASYVVGAVEKKQAARSPSAPFTTSTLQQEAARKLGFSAKQTMVIAQQLYEHGHITYMRTDSVNLASSALKEAAEVIGERFGKKYRLDAPRVFTAKSKGAQEAHEAVRPTRLAATPSDFSSSDRGQKRLYDLIWRRTIASQMQNALVEQTGLDIQSSNLQHPTSNAYTFRATGQVILFDGFMKAYTEEGDDDQNERNVGEGLLPAVSEGDTVTLLKMDPNRHFTEPLPRYTDASLIKALESFGIGRPSTYAPTLATIQNRGYVEKEDKKYRPTEIGTLVNDVLVEHFPAIVDINFTSHIEEELDEIAEGKINWVAVCREFYGPFKKNLTEKEKSVLKQEEVSTVPCPHCGRPMIMKFGRLGKFLACPDPAVKVTLPMPEEAAKIRELEEKTKDERCPVCGKPMIVKRGRFGFFLGCVDYPKCKGISKIWNKSGFKCLNCGIGDIVEKKSRGRGKPFWACTRYPDCTFVMNKKPESEEELRLAFEEWKARPAKPPAKVAGSPANPPIPGKVFKKRKQEPELILLKKLYPKAPRSK